MVKDSQRAEKGYGLGGVIIADNKSKAYFDIPIMATIKAA